VRGDSCGIREGALPREGWSREGDRPEGLWGLEGKSRSGPLISASPEVAGAREGSRESKFKKKAAVWRGKEEGSGLQREGAGVRLIKQDKRTPIERSAFGESQRDRRKKENNIL